MTHEDKVNYIKFWLQRFGDRDNETFYTSVNLNDKIWQISLQYNFETFNDECFQVDPYDWCTHSFKHLAHSSIADRTDEELDGIIRILNEKQRYH